MFSILFDEKQQKSIKTLSKSIKPCQKSIKTLSKSIKPFQKIIKTLSKSIKPTIFKDSGGPDHRFLAPPLPWGLWTLKLMNTLRNLTFLRFGHQSGNYDFSVKFLSKINYFQAWLWNPRFPGFGCWSGNDNFTSKILLKVDHFLAWTWNPRFPRFARLLGTSMFVFKLCVGWWLNSQDTKKPLQVHIGHLKSDIKMT